MLNERWQTVEDAFLARYPGEAERYRRVARVAREAHEGQRRNNGQWYLHHVLDVVELLLDWEVEADVVLGGMLHDVVRYGNIPSLEEIRRRLAQDDLLDLVAMVDRIARHDAVARYARDNRRLRSIFDLMVKDVRAVLIRCANRLANLRRLDAFTPELRRLLLLSSTEIYLPLLERLGMWEVRMEVEDRLFELREPEQHAAIAEWRAREWERRAGAIEEWRQTVAQALAAHGLQDALVEVRLRSVAAVQRRHLDANPTDPRELSRLDARHLYTTIVRVERVEEAYLGLAAVHTCGAPSMNSFRDYIAQPKSNGYAALHTNVVPNSGEPHRVYLRTHRLDEFDRRGILVADVYGYWRAHQPPAGWSASELRPLEQFMRSLRHSQRDRLLILTPRGDVLELPEGATVLDFAYEIHTDVGRQTGAAYVNGVEAPLYTELHSGDVVEIRKNLAREWPDEEWLEWARTSKARENIQAQLGRRPLHLGRRRLDRALRQRGRTLDDLESRLTMLASEMECSADEIFTRIAQGDLRAREIADRLLAPLPASRRTFRQVAIEPTEETRQRFPAWQPEALVGAECCAPQPGSPIAGYLTERAIELHAATCPMLQDPARVLTLRWQSGHVEARHVEFTLRATNRKGLIHDLTGAIRQASVDIIHLEGKRTGQEMDEVRFTLEVANDLELANLITTIRNLPNVTSLTVDGRTAAAVMVDLSHFQSAPTFIFSPFSPGRPVAGEGRFWGREQELRGIESYLTGTDAPSLLVKGPRRIGKTSLIKHLEHSRILREHYRFAFVDLQGVASSRTPEILRGIANRIRRTLEGARPLPAPGPEAFEFNPLETFQDYLAQLTDQHRHANKRVLLALDEFGVLVEAVREGRLDFQVFHTLRSVMQHNPLVTWLLCTSDDVADMLEEDGVLELFNVTQKVRLHHLDPESARRLVQQPLRGQVYFEPDAITAMLRITDCHPYYLHILGSNLISQLNKEQRSTVHESDIDAVVRRHTHLNGSEFLHLWERDRPVQLQVLQALCAPPAATRLAPHDSRQVWRTLASAGIDLTLDEVVATLERLSRLETVSRDLSPAGEIHYHVRVELFRRWLAIHHPLPLQGEAHAVH